MFTLGVKDIQQCQKKRNEEDWDIWDLKFVDGDDFKNHIDYMTFQVCSS